MTKTIIPTFTKGERLRKARHTAGVSVEEMAALLDVTDRTIRNYEGDITPIKRPSLVVWSLRTSVPTGWLENGENHGRTQAVNVSRCTRWSPMWIIPTPEWFGVHPHQLALAL